MQMGKQYLKKGKISENRKNLSENMVVGFNFPLITLLKSGRFGKSHIYFGRGDFGASFYAKTQLRFFFEKPDFSRESLLSKILKRQSQQNRNFE